MGRVPQGSQGYILDLCDQLVAVAPEAVPPFLRSLADVLNRITVSQLDTWYQHGLGLLKENQESGIAFFKIESNTSESMLETLSSSLELDRVKGILRLYCRALSGSGVEIMHTQELVRRNIGWVDEDSASTDGSKVFLPPVVDHYPNKQDNFSWFKVVSTHQVGHLEFGSFEFDFDLPATQFTDRRFEMEVELNSKRAADTTARQAIEAMAQQLTDEGVEVSAEGFLPVGETLEAGPGGSARTYTAIGRYLAMFENGRLAFDIFTVLEDCRLDYRIKLEYPGISRAASRVQNETLERRPPIEQMPIQQAMVELLVHMSLDQFTDLPVPKDYEEVALMLSRILHQLRAAAATVEDTSEATLRAYEIISRLPNQTQEEEDWQDQDLEEPGDFSEEEFQDLVDQLQAAMDQSGETQEGDDYESPDPVDYRGDFKPEMVQLLAKLQADSGEQGEAQPMTQEMLEQLLQESDELELDAEQGEITGSMSTFRPEHHEGGRGAPAQFPTGTGLRAAAQRRRAGR